MFERFTERARQVVVLAQEEARKLSHSYIGTEHVLLGLLAEEEGLAARVLEALEITLDVVRQDVERIVGRNDNVPEGQLPFTPRGKKVLELGLREALSLGHNYIGTEHVLLGLVRENEGVGMRILMEHGTNAEEIRNEVIRMLSGPTRRPMGYTGPTVAELGRAGQKLVDLTVAALEETDGGRRQVAFATALEQLSHLAHKAAVYTRYLAQARGNGSDQT